MEIDTTTIAIPSLIVLAGASERLLERWSAFQRLAPETKRIIALLVATLIALVVQAIEVAASNPPEDNRWLYVIIAATAQQLIHALAKEK